MRLNICLAALAATLVASPAFAQAVPTASDTASAEAKGVVLQAHKLVKNKDLDFGVVTVDSVNGGTVSISAELLGYTYHRWRRRRDAVAEHLPGGQFRWSGRTR